MHQINGPNKNVYYRYQIPKKKKKKKLKKKN